MKPKTRTTNNEPRTNRLNYEAMDNLRKDIFMNWFKLVSQHENAKAAIDDRITSGDVLTLFTGLSRKQKSDILALISGVYVLGYNEK